REARVVPADLPVQAIRSPAAPRDRDTGRPGGAAPARGTNPAARTAPPCPPGPCGRGVVRLPSSREQKEPIPARLDSRCRRKQGQGNAGRALEQAGLVDAPAAGPEADDPESTSRYVERE